MSTSGNRVLAFRSLEHDARAPEAFGAVELDRDRNQWQPSGHRYAPRVRPAVLALSNDRVLVTGGNTALTQIYRSTSQSWVTTKSLPRSLQAPRAVQLAQDQIMIVGIDAAERAPQVRCYLFNPLQDEWRACGEFAIDERATRRWLSLRKIDEQHVLLVYGDKQAAMRDASGEWISVRVRFPSNLQTPSDDEGIPYLEPIATVWDPLSQAWIDATGEYLENDRNLSVARIDNFIYAAADGNRVLRWDPQAKRLTAFEHRGQLNRGNDALVATQDGCLLLWNNGTGFNDEWPQRTDLKHWLLLNPATGQWQEQQASVSVINARAAPLGTGSLVIAGSGRLLAGRGLGVQRLAASCAGVVDIKPVPASYLPKSDTKPNASPASTADHRAKQQSAPQINPVARWLSTLQDRWYDVSTNLQGKLLLGGLLLIVVYRSARRWGEYVITEDESVPGRRIDISIAAIALPIAIAAAGYWVNNIAAGTLILSSALGLFATLRLGMNSESLQQRMLSTLASAFFGLIAALGCGTAIVNAASNALAFLRA
jgi:hypothetical protein